MSLHDKDSDATNDMDGNPKVSDDFLDSSVLLDETNYQEGFKDGYNDGLVSGKEEGREVGLKLGFQVGEELGFYRGCVDIWNSVIQVDPEAFSSRTNRNIQQLGDLLRNYPLLDPESEHVQEMIEAIRRKFKMISTNMGVKLVYESLSRSSSELEVEDI